MVVEWYNEDQVVDVVVAVIYLMATTVDVVLHGSSGVYATWEVAVMRWSNVYMGGVIVVVEW